MRLFGAVLLTAVVTAVVTSAIWIFLYNNPGGRAQAPTVASAPADVARSAPAAQPRSGPPQGPAAPPVAARRIGDAPADLVERRLTLPVPGTDAAVLTPQFYDARGNRGHEAIDITAPRGEPVVAVEDGSIAKLFASDQGGLTVYQFDPDSRYAYYYAHLDSYPEGLAEGQAVKRGQVIGYVGSTGNADPEAPHLHFAIFRLGPEKQWWKGQPIDPYPALSRR